jgi:hypothetical protein
MSHEFPGFLEEHVRNHSSRRFGKYWQIPIHLVQVAFPDKFYNINGLRLSLGEPVYPVTRRYLYFLLGAASEEAFPRLINSFDDGDHNRLFDLEMLLTSFACGLHFSPYPENTNDELTRLFSRFGTRDMETFNRLCYYYYRRHRGTTISNPQSRWDLKLFHVSLELLMLSVSPKVSDGHHREYREELLSLTSICRTKTGHWLNSPPSQAASSTHP